MTQELHSAVCWLKLVNTEKRKSAQLCDKEPQLGPQSALWFQCSRNMEFAPNRKVTKLTLRVQRDQVSNVCGKKNLFSLDSPSDWVLIEVKGTECVINLKPWVCEEVT